MAALETLRKLASWIIGMLIHIIGFIPVLIYSYLYTEFFTKYLIIDPEIPIDWSGSETRTIRIFVRYWISELPLEEHSRQSFLFSPRRGYLESTITPSTFQPARSCSRSTITWRFGKWTTLTWKRRSHRPYSTSLYSVPLLCSFQTRRRHCKLRKVFYVL